MVCTCGPVEDERQVVELRSGAVLVAAFQYEILQIKNRTHDQPLIPFRTQVIPQDHGHDAALIGHLEICL